MKKRNQLTIGLIVAIIMLACACPVSGLPIPGGEEVPTSAPILLPTESVVEPTAVQQQPAANILLSDDFSVPSAEMEEYAGEDGTAGTENGVYVVRSTQDLWQWGKSNSTFTDTVIDVVVAMAVGPTNNNAGFGVICRLTEREDTSVDGYMLAISGDGYYTIRSITAGSMSPLVDWTYSDAINQGITTNNVRATCKGSDLSLEVNGQLLATATAIAGGSQSGSIAFSAISFETAEPIAEGHFDNLVVTAP